MQELLLATNRSSRLRITAIGGGLIGAAVTLLLASAGGYWLHVESMNAQRLEQAQQMQSLRTELSGAQDQVAQAQKALECAPLVWLAKQNATGLGKVQTLVASFPVFKTEPFKTLYADLSAEVLRQGQTATTLAGALEKAPGRCAMAADAEKAGDVLWSSESVSLHKNGWTGVSP